MKYAIYSFCFTLILGQTIRLPAGILPTDFVVVAIIARWFIRHFINRTWPTLPKIQTILIILLITWGGISLLFNLHTLPRNEFFGPLSYLLRISAYLFLLFPFTDWFKSSPKSYLVTWEKSLFFTTSVIIFLGFLQLIFIPDFSFMAEYGWDPHMGRLLSTWFDPNFLAGYLSIVSPIFISRIGEDYRQKTWTKATTATVFLVLALAVSVVLTLSRSGLLAYLIGLLVGVLIYAPLAIIGLAICLVTALTINERFRERVLGIFQIDVTASLRLESWIQTIHDIEKTPWIGVGYNTLRYQNILPETLNSGSGRDSSLLTIWLTTGFVGLILVITIIFERVITFINLAKSNQPLMRRWGVAGLCALAALLIHSMFVNSMTYVHILGILIMYLGIQHDSQTSHT
jgi:O-antigen ligase